MYGQDKFLTKEYSNCTCLATSANSSSLGATKSNHSNPFSVLSAILLIMNFKIEYFMLKIRCLCANYLDKGNVLYLAFKLKITCWLTNFGANKNSSISLLNQINILGLRKKNTLHRGLELHLNQVQIFRNSIKFYI